MINKTYQDFMNAKDKDSFILNAIEGYKSSSLYRTAIDAEKYYNGNNTTILNRMQWFYNSMGQKEQDQFRADNRVCSEFFGKIISQENSYLLANGVTTDDKIKKELGGNKFDVKLQKFGIKALVQSVSWAYCYINKKGQFDVSLFEAKEFIPLFDERTGVLMAGIRFFSIADDKPVTIEVYEMDGKTEYVKKDYKLDVVTPKQAYKIKKSVDILEERVVDSSNWSVLPIFPLYANDRKSSEFTTALKSKIDAYDVINSDFANNLEDNKDIIYMLKNYGGENVGQFLADLKYYNVIKTDEEGDVSTMQREVPHEARRIILEKLREQIYSDAMALDNTTLSGGSLTNIAIKSAMMDLDLKTDKFEWQVIEFMENIINLYLEYKNQPNKEYEISFIRRGIVNDTEVIDNIYKMREDISHLTALKLNPLIDDAEKERDNVEEEGMSKFKINIAPKQGNPVSKTEKKEDEEEEIEEE